MSSTPRYSRRTILQASGALLAGSAGSGDDEDDGLLPDFDWFGGGGDLRITDDGSIVATDPTDIELGNNLSARETDDGLVLEASETDGSNWSYNSQSRLSQDSPIDVPGVWTGAGGSERYRVQAPHDALREGYLVGVAQDYQVVVDPTNWDSDAEALQYVNDQLKDHAPTDFGIVHFSPVDPAGNQLEIDKTVVFGSRTEQFGAIPRGWGFAGQYDPMLQCTIGDGSPMFVLGYNSSNDGVLQLNSTWFGGFAADAGGRDAGFLRLESVTAFTLRHTLARAFDTPTADGVYVLDGETYNSEINRANYIRLPHGDATVSDADVWVVQNTIGDDTKSTPGPPGEIKWEAGCSTYADPSYPFNRAYVQKSDSSSMVLGGRYEGNGGNKVEVQAGHITIPDYFEAGRSEGSNTDDLFFDGASLKIAKGSSWSPNDTGGHNVHIGSNASQVFISDFRDGRMDGNAGDSIHFDAGSSGSDIYEVPYEDSLNGSVSYPSLYWTATRYPDGWRKYRQGSGTWSGGEEQLLNEYIGTGLDVKVEWSVDNTPGSDYRFDEHIGGTTTNNEQAVWLEETVGSAGTDAIEVSWTIYAR